MEHQIAFAFVAERNAEGRHPVILAGSGRLTLATFGRRVHARRCRRHVNRLLARHAVASILGQPDGRCFVALRSKPQLSRATGCRIVRLKSFTAADDPQAVEYAAAVNAVLGNAPRPVGREVA